MMVILYVFRGLRFSSSSLVAFHVIRLRCDGR